MKPRQKLAIHVFSGDAYPNITVTVKPSWIPDITYFRLSTDGFLEKNLAKVEPRALLVDDRLHRYWQRASGRIGRYAIKVRRYAVRKFGRLMNVWKKSDK